MKPRLSLAAKTLFELYLNNFLFFFLKVLIEWYIVIECRQFFRMIFIYHNENKGKACILNVVKLHETILFCFDIVEESLHRTPISSLTITVAKMKIRGMEPGEGISRARMVGCLMVYLFLL